MTSTFRCDDKETLVAYLYDEIDADARRQVALHLRTCAACASELAALQHVRQDLKEWQPPEAQLDFAIVRKPLDPSTLREPQGRPEQGRGTTRSGSARPLDTLGVVPSNVEGRAESRGDDARGRPASVLRPSRWFAPSLPAWAQVAAAALVMAAGLAIANVQVRYGTDGVSVSTGWMAAAPAQERSPRTAGGTGTRDVALSAVEDWRPAVAALESDLRRELQRIRTSTAPVRVRSDAPQAADADALLRRVQALINASEQRQRQELATRMTQFGREIQMQRSSDLVRISQDLGYLRGRTGAVEGSMVNLMRRVSTTQVP